MWLQLTNTVLDSSVQKRQKEAELLIEDSFYW